jgi:hypothetical protein
MSGYTDFLFNPTTYKLSIGTAIENATLNATDPSGAQAKIYVTNYAGQEAQMVARSAGGNPSTTITATLAGEPIGIFGFSGHDGTSFTSDADGGMKMVAAENFTPAAHGNYLLFAIKPTGTNVLDKQMRLDEVGLSVGAFGTHTNMLDVNGTAQITGLTTVEALKTAGSSGNGFLELNAQSVAPAVGAGQSVRLFSLNGALSWKRQTDGFVRTFSSTLTADRTYTWPDASGTVPVSASGGAALSATGNITVDINQQTTDATPDRTADYVMTYDASAATNKKVLLNNISSSWIGANVGATTPLSSTNYAPIVGTSSFNATESNRQFIFPYACTVKNLYIRTTGTQSSTGSLVFTVRKEGLATAVTRTIAASVAAGTYSDVTNTVDFAAGEVISLQVVNNATATSANIISWSAEVVKK